MTERKSNDRAFWIAEADRRKRVAAKQRREARMARKWQLNQVWSTDPLEQVRRAEAEEHARFGRSLREETPR